MKSIIQTINNLPNLMLLKPANQEQINDAELQLGVSFASEYKEYLTSFGAVLADGIELAGIAKSEHRNVVYLTKREWELNSNIPHSMYVVEDTGVDGIVVWQDTKGLIYQSKPNTEAKEIANSLVDYILSRTN